MVKVSRSVEQKRRREIRLVFLIKLGDQARRRGEAQSRAPSARVSNGQSERFIPPRVIQIQMQSPAGQRSAACRRKKLSIGCLRGMQVFLSFFVTWIKPQCLAKLNHGLRGLALGQIKFAQIVVSNCQLRVRSERSLIMQLGLLEIFLRKKRVSKLKLGIWVIRPEL